MTGSNRFVGNWPGVTVEKKEGKLKKHNDVMITDLPGIYSLSPYTLEEVVARNYLITERPDAILNIIDGTNLERNLYLTTQLTELGIPVVVAINMMDVVNKNGDKINTAELSRELGCKVVEISALKSMGIMEAAEAAIDAAKNGKTVPMQTFSRTVEGALAHIEEAAVHNLPKEQQRWYAIKIFERDDKVFEQIKLDKATLEHIEADIKAGKIEYRLDKANIIHCPIGKASFSEEQLQQNFDALMDAIVKAKPSTLKGQYLKSISLAPTMGPGVKVSVAKF